jgi:hypothetical protein
MESTMFEEVLDTFVLFANCTIHRRSCREIATALPPNMGVRGRQTDMGWNLEAAVRIIRGRWLVLMAFAVPNMAAPGRGN